MQTTSPLQVGEPRPLRVPTPTPWDIDLSLIRASIKANPPRSEVPKVRERPSSPLWSVLAAVFVTGAFIFSVIMVLDAAVEMLGGWSTPNGAILALGAMMGTIGGLIVGMIGMMEKQLKRRVRDGAIFIGMFGAVLMALGSASMVVTAIGIVLGTSTGSGCGAFLGWLTRAVN